MELRKLTGPEASVLKYDVLTALSVMGLQGPPVLQTSMMRLMSLVTARYNWRRDEVSIGQRELARMWSVNERTVKREVKRLIEGGWLLCIRPGVRGRVAAYQLNHDRIATLSEPVWALVGTDYAARMESRYGARQTVKVVQLSDYAKLDAPQSGQGPWAQVMAHTARQEPAVHGAWFAKLTFEGCENGVLRLRAPSRFVQRYIETHHLAALLRAAEAELGPLTRLDFV